MSRVEANKVLRRLLLKFAEVLSKRASLDEAKLAAPQVVYSPAPAREK